MSELPSCRTDHEGKELPSCACPACAKELNAATPTKGEGMPKPGDYSLCFGCGSFLVFQQDLTVRLLTIEEIETMDDENRNDLVRCRRMHAVMLDVAKGKK